MLSACQPVSPRTLAPWRPASCGFTHRRLAPQPHTLRAAPRRAAPRRAGRALLQTRASCSVCAWSPGRRGEPVRGCTHAAVISRRNASVNPPRASAAIRQKSASFFVATTIRAYLCLSIMTFNNSRSHLCVAVDGIGHR